MNKRGTGVAFIAIAAFLFSAKYISAAIFGSGLASYNKELFNAMLEYIGYPLSVCSVMALLIGLAYIIWGEYEEFTIKKR